LRKRHETEAVHVYFHKDELDILRSIGAHADQSVRMVIRMIVRDYLIRARLEPIQLVQTTTETLTLEVRA
jgi:hypothetical protein